MHFTGTKIVALDSSVAEVQEMFSSHGSLPTNAMYHHGETPFALLQSHLLLCWHGFCDVSVTFSNASVTLSK